MVISNLFDVGGAEINTRHLSECLQALGQNIQVISMWKPANLDTKFKVHGICFKGKNPHSLPSCVRNFWLMIYMFTKTILVAMCEKIDVFHAHMVLPTGFPVVLACRLLGKTVVVSTRGSDLNIFAYEFLLKPFAKFTLKKADAVIALSRGLKKAALKLGVPNDKVFIIPNGVDTSFFGIDDEKRCRSELNVKIDDKVVLFVGTIESYRRRIKGLKYLLFAMKTVISRVPTAQLMVVGVPPLPDLLDVVSKLRIAGHVSFLGVVPYTKIPHYYDACDVFVLPSLMEGLPTTVLEAMASAKPVVASDIEGCKDLIDDGVNGFLVPPGQTDVLAERIIQVITNDELAVQLGKEARRIAETRYSWESVTKKTVTVYTTVHRSASQIDGICD